MKLNAAQHEQVGRGGSAGSFDTEGRIVDGLLQAYAGELPWKDGVQAGALQTSNDVPRLAA